MKRRKAAVGIAAAAVALGAAVGCSGSSNASECERLTNKALDGYVEGVKTGKQPADTGTVPECEALPDKEKAEIAARVFKERLPGIVEAISDAPVPPVQQGKTPDPWIQGQLDDMNRK